MKLSVIRALYLSLSLLLAQAPFSLEARTPARRDDDKREREKKGAAQPQNRMPSGNSRFQSGGPRNPLTGSSVGGGGNRPKVDNRPNDRDRKPDNRPGGGGNNNRPGGGGNNNQNKGPDNKPKPPVNRPAPLPSTRPAPLPANPGLNRPAPKPGENRPGGGDNKPKGGDNKGKGGDNKPKGGNNNRPSPKLPNVAKNRPGDKDRPGNEPPRSRFVPGKVVYPNQITRPAKRPNHPAYYANRPNQGRPRNVNQIVANTNINQNWGNQWNNKTTIWNQTKVVNNRPVVINNNFRNSVNYAYRPSSWGSRPWWSSSTYHTWHHGSWNYGWNTRWNRYHSYHRPYRPPLNYFPGYPTYHYHDHDHFDAGKVVAWGLAAWGLGSLFYDSGYGSYRNPYQAPPVQTSRQTVINYNQPISVVAAQEVPVSEEAALSDAEKSTAAIERARAEFGNGDYLAALKSTDEAISFAPTDSALHEFRALCLFALGRYGDAAGVLNPVLASGPGWDWATMAGFYSSSDAYTAQLRKLETYVEGSPDSADAHFVLGYHYMVAGFIDEAYAMFDRVVTLQPADTVAIQLRNLAESSSPEAAAAADAGLDPEEPAADASVVVEPVDPGDIEGAWKAPSADGKSITLTLGADGNFSWNYEGAADGKVLSGEWSIDENGQLVLAATDVQMVADISLDGNTMRFILAGSPVGDPGLTFQRL